MHVPLFLLLLYTAEAAAAMADWRLKIRPIQKVVGIYGSIQRYSICLVCARVFYHKAVVCQWPSFRSEIKRVSHEDKTVVMVQVPLAIGMCG